MLNAKDSSIHPLARKLARYIFAYTTVCALLIGVVQCVYFWNHAQAQFERTLNNIALTHIPLLSVSVWDIEPKVIAQQLQQLTGQPEIGYVRLTTRIGSVFEAGEAHLLANATPRSFDILSPNEARKTIGTLEIVTHPSFFLRTMIVTTGTALAGYLVLTLVIYLLIVVAIKRELERPLKQLTAFVNTLSPEHLTTPLRIERGLFHRRDEIDFLIDSFCSLQDGINNHIINLDRMVAERTRELEAAMVSIRKLSDTDTLTGCYNRRLFDKRIIEEIRRTERHQHPLSLLFADIDFFKKINDRFGHACGDQALVVFSQALKKELREHIDWVVRYGGEEFLLILPETDLEHAISVAERIRTLVEKQELSLDGRHLSMTASFGVAQYRPDESADDWVNRADHALYRAKQTGRNRVCA